ncbi:MAG: hypothetical protein MUF68_05525, partial [Cyclobacteriaceae bacterium]|nr:hypothetical protein [Cyclobacteriaceae bacterium]
MNRPITGLLSTCFLVFAFTIASAQKEITYSLGLFGGISSTFSNDEGVSKDPRYQYRYNIRTIPVGLHLGIDFKGYGFMIDPQVTQVGQQLNIINISGGQVGKRDIQQMYFQIPFSYKKHIVDLSFFKV